MSSISQAQLCLSLLAEWRHLSADNSDIVLDGHSLTVAGIAAIADKRFRSVVTSSTVDALLRDNAAYLESQVISGHVIYGVNTGYGGSADVRSADALAMQRSLIRHLNIGFGDQLEADVMRAVMAVRANSLSLGYSGVRPEVVDLLCRMVTADVVPVTPLRGSVSASGDLAPTSYVAACMSGREDVDVIVGGTRQMSAPEAFAEVGLKAVAFGPKEALAVVNASSVGASLAAVTLFDAGLAMLLTQVVTALTAEALKGRVEAFQETVHDVCLPHRGNAEVARHIRSLLAGSSHVKPVSHERTTERLVAVVADGESVVGCGDGRAELKQDRYALRTAAQWLGPAVETWIESVRRVTIELNSANDNPLIDHRRDEILHCGNFQGIAITVAMDQVRQSIQLCGKLVFAQLSEVLNHLSGHGLPPNLSGTDVCIDFGFKGVDTATASYVSELDHVTPPLTNHVVSAEMHNQSVNSMALVSARTTSTALKLLQMILTNALCALTQALDLRWLERRVKTMAAKILDQHGVRVPTQFYTSYETSDIWRFVPWYDVAYRPQRVVARILQTMAPPTNGFSKDAFVQDLVGEMEALMVDVNAGRFTDEVALTLGEGTRQMYLYIRQDLNIPFHYGQETLDKSLGKIFKAITSRALVDLTIKLFSVTN
jgi:phenylalanine ammonia-lyase